MTTLKEIIKKLNNGTLAENETVEFKTAMPTDLSLLAKYMVGIANNGGGYIILGVRKKPDGVILIGIDKTHNSVLNDINNAVDNFTTGVEINYSLKTIKNKKIGIITVVPNPSDPPDAYFCRKDTSPEKIIRYRILRDGGSQKIIAEEKKLYKKVYKYMSIDTFISCMYHGSWRFFEPNKWDDKFERRFYCAKYQIPTAKGSTPQLFATCVTREKNSGAAWKVYSHGQGLGAHCLQLELDVVELRKQLRNDQFQISEKEVKYHNDYYILNLHNPKKSKDYQKYFNNFSIANFLNLLVLKRNAYTYEKEIRFFAIPINRCGQRSSGKKSMHKDLEIDWSGVIKSIRIDKACSDSELLSFKQACLFAKINPIIKGYSFTVQIPISNNYPQIPTERFSIDDMPGRQRIIIK